MPNKQNQTYANSLYWDTRYKDSKSTNFEWFFGYGALKHLITRYCNSESPCLQVGCGNSVIQEGMAADGFTVENIDISHEVIEQMALQHRGIPALSYSVGDCRHMPQLPSDSFGSCIDKGTLDAVVCSKTGHVDSESYVKEVFRILRPGGSFLLLSLAGPSTRLSILQVPGWDVSVFLLPKPDVYMKAEASILKRPCGAGLNDQHLDKMLPIHHRGPFSPEQVASELSKVDDRDYFFLYACQKATASKGFATASISSASTDVSGFSADAGSGNADVRGALGTSHDQMEGFSPAATEDQGLRP